MNRIRYIDNPEMQQQIRNNPTFTALAADAAFDREVQAMVQNYTYVVSGSVGGGQSLPFNLVIEQGSDFKSCQLMGSAFSYSATIATDFPVPGNANWSMRGLSMRVTDTGSGRELFNNDTPIETMLTPGYGLNFVQPLVFKYLFKRNSVIRFLLTNRESLSTRIHTFSISINGYKVYTPTPQTPVA